MDTTVPATTDDDTTAGELPARWVVTMVYHPDVEFEGRRVVAAPNATIELGRGGDAFGEAALEHERLSRKHASIAVNSLDEIRAVDQESRNGTFVNGRRITTRPLDAGDVISIGDLMLLVSRGRLNADERPTDVALAGAQRLADDDATLLIAGEAGVGKDRLARHIHAACERTGPFIVLRCGAMTDDLMPDELFGHAPGSRSADDPGRPGLLEAAEGGILYLDGVEDASVLLQNSLLGFLDTGDARRIGEQRSRQLDVRVLASTRKTVAELSAGRGVRRELVQRLTSRVLRVPPLRERREELLGLGRTLVEQFSGEQRTMHRKLRLALLRHDYPGNVRELQALVETAIVDDDGDGALKLSPGVSERLQADDPEASRMSRVSAGTTFVVSGAGDWFRYERERTDIAKRRILCRLVAVLAEQRQNSPGTAISVDELLAAGWPDEQIIHEAGRNRVHVALTTLRKLGLRDVILRRDDGYLFDPDIPIRLENR